jgi:hypothetical protein
VPSKLEEQDWSTIIRRIKNGKCTPFLGAGACSGVIPLGSEIAAKWAKKYHYPLEDSGDLVKVAQFMAIQNDPMVPKEEIQKEFENIKAPDFSNINEPHAFLADLPLPIYITTNYDDFMIKALKHFNRDPRREFSRWNKIIKAHQPNIFDEDFTPSAANPLVFHLHGHTEMLESMVITEDDYLDFLIKISEDSNLLPFKIREAFAGTSLLFLGTSLLFLGYQLTDWDFRVLFRSLVGYLEKSLTRTHVSVQLLPVGDTVSDEEKEKTQRYFDRYFQKLEIRVYWGKCQEFITDLRKHIESFNDAEQN